MGGSWRKGISKGVMRAMSAYIGGMKHYATAAISAIFLAFAPVPVMAQEDEPRSLMDEGMDLFFKGLRDEFSPQLEELQDLLGEVGPSMRGFVEQMGPALGALMDEVKDWSRYEAPEILPNGDIIIRRKPDPAPEKEPPAEGQIDL